MTEAYDRGPSLGNGTLFVSSVRRSCFFVAWVPVRDDLASGIWGSACFVCEVVPVFVWALYYCDFSLYVFQWPCESSHGFPSFFYDLWSDPDSFCCCFAFVFDR